MSWPLIALKDLVDINIGRTPSRDNADYWGNGTPWLSIRDMNQGKILLKTAEQITPQALEDTKIGLATKGTVLFSFKLSIGKVGIAGLDMCHNEAIASMPIKKGVDLCEEYLYFALKQLDSSKDTDRAVMGATLNKKKMAELKIPLPPLETQKQIAAVLEKADQLRKDCQQMEQELNSLAQSVFIDMFGSKASGYSEWPLHRIEELAESKKGSMRTGPFGSDLKHSEFVDEGIAVIGIDNAVKNEFAWGERRFITPEKYEKLKRYRVYPQDLIITIMGTTGRIAVIPDDIPLSISTKHLAVITLDKDKVIPEFLATAIKTHPDLLHQIIDSNKGAIMDGLNLGLIKALSLRLPPLDLQLKYLAVLKVIRERIFESRSSHEQNNDLFNSLMQKAFKGELML
ncbi:restriction endonuclease subunit S [Vibrio fluvialis]|nr:restriction endonuclease subunit S [Vibrio fluvialis]MBY8093006.1 restriction endonuclease subunit S [Vibrio fluvialis]MBY8100590.1 restriction endonuclease subunit S [Vibrio fluvialis]